MYPLIAMALALALLLALLRLKVKLGRAMVISALALAVLLRVTPALLWQTLAAEWRDRPLTQTTGYLFLTLTALVCLVNVLGVAMRQTGVSARLVPALQGLFRSRRLALAAIPMLMGMLPTPGGIMLSAPMVRDLADHIGVNRPRAAAINLLFRHQWETVWPLFPSVPLIQSMFGISALTLISHNLAITLFGTLGGVLFLLLAAMPPKKPEHRSHPPLAQNLRGFLHALWPIALVAVLYASFNLPPAAGILPAIIVFLLLHKMPLARWPAVFKAGLQPDFALLVFGALFFKLNLEAGRAIPVVVQFLSAMHVPKHLLIFLLPFLVGFLTGVTMPSVAITFPFLMHFIGTGAEMKVGLEVLAFSGLICGLMLTPVHLCIALSASYFEAPLGKIVLKLLAPAACVAAAGATMAALFG
ncbi:MAG: DUF401 family protein [Phycisphaerales bacterium]|nr:MAG: DUF401 family protein [Phycisphaerales bacterium]